MRSKHIFFLAFTVTMFASACTAAEKKPDTSLRGSDCVFFRTVYDWKSLDDHNLVIWAPSHRVAYQVYTMVPLVGLNFAMKLGFVDRDHDGQLCGFSRDEIVIADHSFPQRATITAMKRLDDEGIAKLEEQYKVKLNYGKKQKPKEPDREKAQ
jgi:hypothetical protein